MVIDSNILFLTRRYITMPDLKFSLTTWGSPASEKRVLLLHGLMGTGTVWFKVAEKLAMAGRFLLGRLREPADKEQDTWV